MSASDARVPRPAPLSFLAFDYGTRHTGLATGNTLLRRAQPLKTLHVAGQARWAAIGEVIRQWQPNALVVGVPFHPDGAPHENTERARRFVRQLRARYALPVHEVDERYTTTQARAEGARDLDAASAAIILDQFFAAADDPDTRGPG
jgi:putative Holliday junction resolvase